MDDIQQCPRHHEFRFTTSFGQQFYAVQTLVARRGVFGLKYGGSEHQPHQRTGPSYDVYPVRITDRT